MNFVVNIKSLSLSLTPLRRSLKIFLLSCLLAFGLSQVHGQKVQKFSDPGGKNPIWIDDPGQIYRHFGSGIRIIIHAKFDHTTTPPLWTGFYIYAEGMGCMSHSELTLFLEENVQINVQASDKFPCPEWSSFEINEDQIRNLSSLRMEGILITNSAEGTIWADSPTDPRYWIKMCKGLKKVRN